MVFSVDVKEPRATRVVSRVPGGRVEASVTARPSWRVIEYPGSGDEKRVSDAGSISVQTECVKKSIEYADRAKKGKLFFHLLCQYCFFFFDFCFLFLFLTEVIIYGVSIWLIDLIWFVHVIPPFFLSADFGADMNNQFSVCSSSSSIY